MTRNKAVLDFFKLYAGRTNERNQLPRSDASKLIQSGWFGVGYTLMAPNLINGIASGRKRMAYSCQTPSEIAGLDSWFDQLSQQGWIPAFRYYLAKGKCPLRNDAFKGLVVSRDTYSGYEAIVEMVPYVSDSSLPEAVRSMARYTAEHMNVAAAASEFADVGSLLLSGEHVLVYSSI